MSKKRRNGRKSDIHNLEQALSHNGSAILEGPKRKTWSIHDLKHVAPLKPAQSDMFAAWDEYDHICAHGSAGSGKTFLALYLALQEVLNQTQTKIIIVRSSVPTRDVGFLPGTLEEKMQQYEEPYKAIIWELIGKPTSYQDMKDAGKIEFHSTSFLRGLTWDNAIVIVDEAENCDFAELDTVITRLGKNTRMILCGDVSQTDLARRRNEAEGMTKFMKILENINSFDFIEFTNQDIVRSGIVKSYLLAKSHSQQTDQR